MKNKVKNALGKAKKNLKNIVFGTVLSAGLAGGMNPVSAQERLIYDPFNHPIKNNQEWVDMDKSQKEAYVDSALKEDKSHLNLWIPGGGYKYPETLCGNMVGQLLTNFNGVANLDTLNKDDFFFKHYDFSNNGKWQIPVQYISTYADNNVDPIGSHAIGGVITGDSASSFSDWSFIDSYQHKITKPGNWDMVDGEPIMIRFYSGVTNHTGPPQKLNDVLKFEKIDGKYIPTYKDPALVLTNPKLDSIPPTINTTFKEVNTNRPDTLNLNYDIHDGEYVETKRYGNNFLHYDYDFYSGHFLDSGFYKIDNDEKVNFDFKFVPFEWVLASKPIYNQSGTIPLDKSEGEHRVVISASDYGGKFKKGNTATDTIKYIIDTTSPELNTSINPIEGTDSANISISASDNYLDSAKYSFNNSDWKYFSNDTSFNVKLKEGENLVKTHAKDKAGNFSDLEKELIYNPPISDTIKPTLSYEGIEDGNIYDSKFNIDILAIDENLKDYGYQIMKEEEKILSPKKSLLESKGNVEFDLENGDYSIQFYANDFYSNETLTDTIKFKVDKTTSLEKIALDQNSKFYPNPVSTEGILEYIPSGENVNLEIYNRNGQKLEEFIDKDNDGKMNLNLSKYQQGVYIYKASNGSSGKIVKK